MVGAIRMTDITPTRRELADIARRRHVKEARRKAKTDRVRCPQKSSRGRERNNAYLAWLGVSRASRDMGGCDGRGGGASERRSGRGKPSPAWA